MSPCAEVGDTSAAQSRRSAVAARDTGLEERVDGIAGVRGVAQGVNGVEVVCGSESTSGGLSGDYISNTVSTWSPAGLLLQ